MRHAACILLLLSTIVGVSLPVPVWAGSTYSKVTVTRLLVFQASSGSNPGSLILFTPATADSEGCTKSGQGYAWIDWTSTLLPDGRSLYATVLAASLAGKQLDIVVGGCSQGYYPLVYQIVMYP
jgi:hypothetical protein